MQTNTANLKKLVKDFLLMGEHERTELFKTPHDMIPDIDARAKLFLVLPLGESVRLLSEIRSIEIDDFMFNRILEIPKTEQFVFNDLLPKLSPGRLAHLVFNTGPFGNIDNLFNILPIQTVVALIDEGVLETKEHEEKIFEILTKITYTERERRTIFLQQIKPNTIRLLLSHSFLNLGKKSQGIIINDISKIEEVKRIAQICAVLNPKKASVILNKITDPVRQRKVLKLLPQQYKDAFFSSNSKSKKDILKSSEIDITKISLGKKKDFFIKFPNSPQVNKLSIAERIQIFA